MTGAVLANRRSRPGPAHSPFGGKYASPLATNGDGSLYNPWSIIQALQLAAPGETVWLRDGNADTTTGWIQTADGASGSQITYRNYPGERCRIRFVGSTFNAGTTLDVQGDRVTLRDLEVCFWSSVPHRYFGTDFTSSRRGSVTIGPYGRLINSYVHDAMAGPHCDDPAIAGITYGNLLLNLGYSDDNRGHGPGIYQNNPGPDLKVIRHNLAVYGFGSGLKTAGDQGGASHFRIQENILHRPNSHYELIPVEAGAGGLAAWEVYSDIDITDMVFEANVIYARNVPNSAKAAYNAWSFLDSLHHDMAVIDNWALGRNGFTDVYGFPNGLTYQRNTTYVPRDTANSPSGVVNLDPFDWGAGRVYEIGHVVYRSGTTYVCAVPHTSTSTFDPTKWTVFDFAAVYDFSDNAYYGGYAGVAPLEPFILPGGVHATFAEWVAFVNDLNSSYSRDGVPPDRHWVFPNEYEAGRANVAVFNENAKASTVAVDLSGVTGLADGDRIWVWSATNPDQGPVLGGTNGLVYDEGTGLVLPMTVAAAGSVQVPYGAQNDLPGYVPPHTLPDFGSFVVRKMAHGPGYGSHPSLDIQ